MRSKRDSRSEIVAEEVWSSVFSMAGRGALNL
jgi:hypothetical protein